MTTPPSPSRRKEKEDEVIQCHLPIWCQIITLIDPDHFFSDLLILLLRHSARNHPKFICHEKNSPPLFWQDHAGPCLDFFVYLCDTGSACCNQFRWFCPRYQCHARHQINYFRITRSEDDNYSADSDPFSSNRADSV